MGPFATMALASVADARARLKDVRREMILAAIAVLLGLSAWAMVMTAAVLKLVRLTGDPLLSLVLGALALGLTAGLVLMIGAALRRRSRKARQARQARQALALTTALALLPSGRTGSIATLALVAAGLGFALWPNKRD
ncbi:hypothetical protein [Pannonibacter sp.]|uniref:hypothetical protein n=1 Tax=Pannonibacter sp. TaxID=1906786 RepID=UPI003F6E97BF